MSSGHTLDELVETSARRTPDALALVDAKKRLTYAELDGLSNQLARAFQAMGVQPGDRVGIWLEKSVEAVAAMQAALRLRAVYVPLDPLNPGARVGKIVHDCAMKLVVSDAARARQLSEAKVQVPLFSLEGEGPHSFAGARALSPARIDRPAAREHDLAYILYTSGSTGVPKGVCISHLNALAFIKWAAEEIHAGPADRFGNHAPFFFDLSVLDLYSSFLVGASTWLVPEAMAFAPKNLVDFICRNALTVWYSVPSALVLMMEQGKLLEAELPLRVVIFAGEPFPMKHLRTLRRALPRQRLLNLYGPTETNVCTFYEVKALSDDAETIPIGRACSGDTVWIDPPADDPDAAARGEGELLVKGPTVMLGYWGKPPQGEAPYRTGDLVKQREDGELIYLGRRDHMVKVRGRRVELGEIETALLEHPAVHECAVVVDGEGPTSRLVGFVVKQPGMDLPLLEVKRHCAARLPRYMIVDEVRFLSELPRTRNGKTDRLTLKASLTAGR